MHAQLHLPLGRRPLRVVNRFGGVLHEVDQHLFNQNGIDIHLGHACGHHLAQAHLSAAQFNAGEFNRLSHHGDNVGLRAVGFAAFHKAADALNDLTGALRGADVFALASDTEQAPLSVIEAMASGLPILSTDVGDVRAMVAPENQRFIVPLADDQAYQRGLAELVADADLAAALGRANRLRAEAQFDVRQMVRLYAHVYALPDPTACSAVLA